MKVYGGVGLTTTTWPATGAPSGPASATNKAGPLPPVRSHSSSADGTQISHYALRLGFDECSSSVCHQSRHLDQAYRQ